ncbi:hypothetical protein [Kribbella sp. NBC_00359]|uniref:hypothetical protein n=1 Tax=Kribbella sp. NBC_00359 TaxID=2975966 RepID=UPI002E1DB2AE
MVVFYDAAGARGCPIGMANLTGLLYICQDDLYICRDDTGWIGFEPEGFSAKTRSRACSRWLASRSSSLSEGSLSSMTTWYGRARRCRRSDAPRWTLSGESLR